MATSLILEKTGAQSIRVVSALDEVEVLSFDQTREVIKRSLETELAEAARRGELEKVDLTVWLNRAHHLSLSDAQNVIQTLTQTSRMIAFSALPPIHSASEGTTLLWPDQWAEYFAAQQFVLVDLFRDVLCRFANVPEHLSANLVLFVHKDVLTAHPEWQDHVFTTARRLVHPEMICRHSSLIVTHQEADSISSYILEKWKSLPTLRPFISVAMSFHSGGHLAHRSLNGLAVMCAQAEKAGIEVEVFCTLDNADEITTEIVTRHPFVRSKAQALLLNHCDLSCSRNHAVDAAAGDYIAILDGDDLYSPSWLTAALNRCHKLTLPVIVHPEKIVSFGSSKGMFNVIDTLATAPSAYSPLINNNWPSTAFAPRLIFQSIPYVRPDLKQSGFGYEDWHWNCETLAAGIQHVVAPNTAFYYRRKVNSMVVEHASNQAIFRPTAFVKSTRLANIFTASA